MSSIIALLGQEQGRVTHFLSKINTPVIAKKGVSLDLASAVFSQMASKEAFLTAAEEIIFDNDLCLGFDLFKDDERVFFANHKNLVIEHIAKMIGDDDMVEIANYIHDGVDYDVYNKFTEQDYITILDGEHPNDKSPLAELDKYIAEWAVKMSILETCRTWNKYMAENCRPLAEMK